MSQWQLKESGEPVVLLISTQIHAFLLTVSGPVQNSLCRNARVEECVSVTPEVLPLPGECGHCFELIETSSDAAKRPPAEEAKAEKEEVTCPRCHKVWTYAGEDAVLSVVLMKRDGCPAVGCGRAA